ncbi:hypothetical protein FGU46_03210 [Methanobacterium sp. CWC-01]|uniref:hypothetical protein n=1 Tax=Methanobacterium aridiramus TaxID=2584467 RepID=UPI002578EF48|nr:hypothetical protein [Methanobacterium sp. CWC-01]WJI09168.1 hypothetical protein FGU46_03210 [Methanobacterium sp. CWC-01]
MSKDFRIGAGIVRSEYVSSHPNFLKSFEIGDEVFIIHKDDMWNMVQNHNRRVRELCTLLDKSLNYELTDEELERACRIIEIQKEIDKS